MFLCVLPSPDIAEDNLQKSFLEAGMHYFRGYDKDGNKLCGFFEMTNFSLPIYLGACDTLVFC